jgi:hypothetical protein
MIIERTDNEIIFRLPKDIDVDYLQDMMNLFEYMEIAKKSKAKQKDVDELVKTIKKGDIKEQKSF